MIRTGDSPDETALAAALAVAPYPTTRTRLWLEAVYIAHLLVVASLALENGADEDTAIAALLHDVVEDAGTVIYPACAASYDSAASSAILLKYSRLSANPLA